MTDSKVNSPLPDSVTNILLDIEGTTTSIKFVVDTLFPYARQNIFKYLEEHWEEPELQQIVQLLRLQCAEDEANGMAGIEKIAPETSFPGEILPSVACNVFWQMNHNRKTTSLKELQGKILKQGYSTGDLISHVYDDVPIAFKRWKDSGKKIYIYSSGSIEAQKLVFGHSLAGDLTQYISGFFDTTTGPKMESGSYKTIAAQVLSEPEKFVFFTDVPAEAYAAKEAGMHARLLIRPGNAPITEADKNNLELENDFNNL